MTPDELAAPIAFIDTETTGLNREYDDIWEFAGIRVDPFGESRTLHLFVDHDCRKAYGLPEPFLSLHATRCPAQVGDPGKVEATRLEAAAMISAFLESSPGTDTHIAGLMVDFDADMIARLLRSAGLTPRPWHYHTIEIESMALGYLQATARALETHGYRAARSAIGDVVTVSALQEAATPPWKSDRLAALLGVEPVEGRHMALADARWARAIYDAMTRS